MPEPALRCLESHPPERVAVLINIQEDGPGTNGVLARLGNRAGLGFNIHTPAFEIAFLLRLIREHGLSPQVRFGLAHPAADGTNTFLHPRYYQAVGTRLAGFLEPLRSAGVEPSFDCGFAPCMFPPGFLDALGPAAAGIGSCCSPVLDILPDGQVVSCFALATLAREPLPEAETADALRSRFTARLSGYRKLGVFRECATCEARRVARCNGGCLSASIKRLRPAAGDQHP